MNRGYCQTCQKYADTGKFCDKCGGKLIFFQASSNQQNSAAPNVTYPQASVKKMPLPNSSRQLQSYGSDSVFGFRNMDKLTVIGIVLLALYNIIGLIICLFVAENVIRDKQVFLVKINVSYFWLWFLVIINFLFLIGTILLKKNKSVLCMVGQGILWLFTLAVTFSVKDINYDDMNIAWSNGIVSSFGMNTEVSRVLGVSAFSIGHLFVIVLWIAALICVALGRTREY